MSLPTHFTLNTGAKIPALGLGTWKSPPGAVRKAVECALREGYRHIDTAHVYGNEVEIGEGIRDSGVPREEIFITGKLWNSHHPDVKAGLEKTLKNLGVEYLDLYLIHWPVRLVPNADSEIFPVNPDGTRAVDRSWDQRDTWRQMEEIYKTTDKVRAIGLGNWSVPYLEELSKMWTVVPAVNQIELHPYLPQHEVRKACAKHGILVEAYSPLGSTGGPIMSFPGIQQVADKNGISAACLLISYHINNGFVVLSKSVTPKWIAVNKHVVPLPKEDVEYLDNLAGGNTRRLNTPLWGHDIGFDDWYGPKKQ